MSLRRPVPALRPFVEAVWASATSHPVAPREHVLPCGGMHLAIRLDGHPLRLYRDGSDDAGQVVSDAVVAGASASFYIKDTSQPTRSVGVLLRPGAAQALFGCDADALASRHVALQDLWGSQAVRLCERLNECADEAGRVELVQSALLARLRPVRAMHPAIAQTLQGLATGAPVRALVAASGCSHRTLLARFRAATGLTPKAYARVLRFQRAARALARGQRLADVAYDAGYSDQAHFNREFRALSGMTPQAYRAASVRELVHVPVPVPGAAPKVNFVQDRRIARF